jgi:hypothetical protein
MTCPACNGAPDGGVRVSCPGGAITRSTCSFCRNTGVVTEDKFRAFRQGRVAMEERISVDLSLREAAKLLKLPASNMSDFEWGRLPPNVMDDIAAQAHALYLSRARAALASHDRAARGPKS